MTAISPRRGMIRPISDLPDLVGAAAWQEVEGQDGKAYRTGAGGLPFPDDPGGFGAVSADDEEFDDAAAFAARWTLEAVPPAPHSYVVNDPFAPSRVRVDWTDVATTAYLSAFCLPTAIDLTQDFNVTFDIAGAFPAAAGGPLVGVGVRASAAANSAGVLFAATIDATALEIREYTNIGTGAFVSRLALNLGSGVWPRRWFLHLERHGANSWAAGYSADGATWKWQRGINVTAVAQTRLWFMIKRDNVGVPNQGAINWIRWNRFFLAAT